MFTVREIAMKLKVAASTVYSLIQAGKLIACRVGLGRGALRVSEDDLQLYLAATRFVPQPIKTVSSVRLKHLK
jgi:excisionase family DNA binding protein